MNLKNVLLCAVVGAVVLSLTASAGEYMPGLAAHYYKDATNWNGLWPDDTDAPLANPKDCTFTAYKYTEIEPLINHLFVRSGWFSVRWVGYIDIPGPGDNVFLFDLWADDGCRLQIDDQILINSWYACPENIPEAHRVATITLSPGKHRIIVEYFQGQSLEQNDADPIKLYWACAALGINKQIVPEERFFHKAEDRVITEDNDWSIKPPETAEQLATSMWDDAQRAEENGDYVYALRLYRRIIQLAPDSEVAAKARERVLAIESDPTKLR